VAPGTATEEIGDRFFREMVWSLRNGVLAITRDGRVAVFNDIAYRTLDLEPDRGNLGRPYSEVLAHSHDIARILDGAFKLTHLPNRAELRLASGKVIGYTLSLVKDAGAETVGAALFFKDLTRVEQLEERERLRDRLAALGEMAAAIAHEVKNPLAGIEVMAGVLKRQLDSEDAQQILSDIITEAKMANAIVQEVLEFVRPIQLQVEPVPLGRVLRDAVGMAESQIDPRSTSVSVSVPDSLPDLSGDPHQLRQLFTNLLTNAFEALDGRGQIEVKTWLAAEDSRRTSVEELAEPSRPLMVEVADDGPGVPADITDKIFGPFFTTKPRGSGLGLAIVRKIVDAHDGRIDVESRPTGGTCFRIALPLTSEHRTAQPLFAGSPPDTRTRAHDERG
jgi:signal transduction histidine kinase